MYSQAQFNSQWTYGKAWHQFYTHHQKKASTQVQIHKRDCFEIRTATQKVYFVIQKSLLVSFYANSTQLNIGNIN